MTSSTTSLPAVLTGDWNLDTNHARIGFIARHAMVTKVRGAFADFEGSLHLDAENPTASSAKIAIEVTSVDTGNGQRDEYLRTNDFFGAPSFPQITFVSTAVEQKDEETFALTGDLSIKGVTKPVTIDWEFTGVATDPFGNVRAGFEGKAIINRTDYGVSFNAALETGGVLVSDKITLEFDVSAVKVVA